MYNEIMPQEEVLVLQKKKKKRTPAKPVDEEVETMFSKEAMGVLRTEGSILSPQESLLSRNMRPFTNDDSRDSDVMSGIFEGTVYESDYSITETEASVSQHSIHVMESMYVDLIQVYDGIPDIEEIAEDIESRKSVNVKEEARPTDEGIFVDPLSGEILPKSKVVSAVAAEPATDEMGDDEDEKETESSEELQAEMSISEDSEILQLLELEKMEKEVLAKQERKVDVLDDFLITQRVTTEEKPNLPLLRAEQLVHERMYKIMLKEAEDFLQTLIEEVVEIIEYKQPIEILRNNLDKHAVMEEILTKLNELEVEHAIRARLNRKTIEFYKRKGLYLAITDDSPEQIMENIEKLKYATSQLDRALGLEHTKRMKFELKQKQLNAKLEKMRVIAEQKEEEFKTLVLNSLVKNKGASLTAISGILDEMSRTYNDVCKTYLSLIQIQHTKAELQEQNDYIEYGQGLQKYVVLQTETKDLHKKVEDRNVELGKVRARCNRDIHALSNIKVKGDIIRIVNSMKKKTLACLLANRKDTREKLVHLKKEHLHLQKEIRELSFQTGLLSKPILLKDYDTTVEQTELTTQNIAALREKQRELLEQIAKIELKYKAR